MLALISPLIARGAIDNTKRDRIVLDLWMQGEEAAPLHLEMRGNCWQDIAGCRVEFENALAKPFPAGAAEPEVAQLIREHAAGGKGQRIYAGDITLSRREARGRVVHNLLSVEFFIGVRVRVLLQSAQFRFKVERGTWRLTDEEDAAQRLFNREVMHEHVLYSVNHFRGAALALTGGGFPPCDWDGRLNRAEAYMSIVPTLMEKYRGQPGGALSEAYLVDRTDLLTEAAEEEDAYGHNRACRPHSWEMLDFIEPEYVDQVSQAMRHPLFHDASRMTEAVKESVIEQVGKAVEREFAQVFLPLYTGAVTHTLSTILLTQDEDYSADTAALRVEGLRHILGELGEGIATLPPAQQAPLERALNTLTNSLSTFCSTLKHG